MDTNGFGGSPNTSLPPGDFVVGPKGASQLYIFLSGTEGYVYNYAVLIKYVENSVEHRIQFGSRKTPLRVALTLGDLNFSILIGI